MMGLILLGLAIAFAIGVIAIMYQLQMYWKEERDFKRTQYEFKARNHRLMWPDLYPKDKKEDDE